ncbi:Sulphatase-modifying factor protein [Cellulophaga algicola DSM 14237]|uniref:Sulphatase-modifying factor protein n=2 Tax=Cellulophaga TaxID=104264 RepID=E6X8Q6_CELAD|nr:Sulphatase-modifying factor protein [Cellulophaga algicola DSM 14237]
MKKSTVYFLFVLTLLLHSSCVEKKAEPLTSANFIFVKGGIMKNKNSQLYGIKGKVLDFYMGKFEVTQKEWNEIMPINPSNTIGDNLPVEMVTWYECITYCNKRSNKEGLLPYYAIDTTKDTLDGDIRINKKANGYRLPTEVEWEYAAGGGQLSKSFTFSGSNEINSVAWTWKDTGDTILSGNWNYRSMQRNHCSTKPVGLKKPNELGFYDMTGNVMEWCEEWHVTEHISKGTYRTQRGGGWINIDDYAKVAHRGYNEAKRRAMDQGFRICRNKE